MGLLFILEFDSFWLRSSIDWCQLSTLLFNHEGPVLCLTKIISMWLLKKWIFEYVDIQPWMLHQLEFYFILTWRVFFVASNTFHILFTLIKITNSTWQRSMFDEIMILSDDLTHRVMSSEIILTSICMWNVFGILLSLCSISFSRQKWVFFQDSNLDVSFN